MSRRQAEALIRRKLADRINAHAEGIRSEEYGLLERHRSGSGVLYPGNKNRSSAPGEPPARQTGRLMESIKVLRRAKPNNLIGEVGPDPDAFANEAPYPAFLEYGTSKMQKRPYVRPALATYKRKVGRL